MSSQSKPAVVAVSDPTASSLATGLALAGRPVALAEVLPLPAGLPGRFEPDPVVI